MYLYMCMLKEKLRTFDNVHKFKYISDLHADAGYSKRLNLLEEDFPGANVILHKKGKLPPVCL